MYIWLWRILDGVLYILWFRTVHIFILWEQFRHGHDQIGRGRLLQNEAVHASGGNPFNLCVPHANIINFSDLPRPRPLTEKGGRSCRLEKGCSILVPALGRQLPRSVQAPTGTNGPEAPMCRPANAPPASHPNAFLPLFQQPALSTPAARNICRQALLCRLNSCSRQINLLRGRPQHQALRSMHHTTHNCPTTLGS